MGVEYIEASQRWEIISRLVRTMRQEGSWAGETHVQKCIMFLQELLGIQMGYDFILYKFGPFSFELRSDLVQMRARLMLDVEPRIEYGPSFTLGPRGELAADRSEQYEEAVNFISKEMSRKDTRTLERLSTAFYVQRKNPELSDIEVANRVCELKPHISFEQAHRAVEELEGLRSHCEMQEGWRKLQEHEV